MIVYLNASYAKISKHNIKCTTFIFICYMHNFNGTEKPMLNAKITASIILNTAYDLQKLKLKSTNS